VIESMRKGTGKEKGNKAIEGEPELLHLL
jgi:hypothetical protein